MEHILKLVARQSTATIGSLTRAWLWVMGLTSGPLLTISLSGFKRSDVTVDMIARTLGGCFVAGLVISVPAMAVLTIIHIARKW